MLPSLAGDGLIRTPGFTVNMLQLRYSHLPLFAAKSDGRSLSGARDIRYVGVAYHFNDRGDIATCAHVVNSLLEGEALVAVEIHGDSLMYPVRGIECHKKYDFAVGNVQRENYKAIPISDEPEIFIGSDVMSFGFTTDGLVEERLLTVPRLLKGHVVRTHPMPMLAAAKSTCEVSFPAHSGFSGTPLIYDRKATCLAGMLYGNFESTIMLHKCTQVDDSGNKFSEEIHKVIELGAVHTAPDIRSFLDDLGITRIALARSVDLADRD